MLSLDNLLIEATEFAIWFNEVLVLVAITAATAKAAWQMALLAIRRDAQAQSARMIWLGYARWLVAALTLQLGADILESSIAPSWQAIAQLAAIAAIRTFLNYFLERDIREAAEHEPGETAR